MNVLQRSSIRCQALACSALTSQPKLYRTQAATKRSVRQPLNRLNVRNENLTESIDEGPNESKPEGIKLARRTLKVSFTCNKCGTRTERLVNPQAWEKGLVFAQCKGCEVWHKLRDEMQLVDEIVFADKE